MQFTTALLLTTLTTAASAAANNVWHIHDFTATCRGFECSYLFNIVGEASADLPEFQAQCVGRTGPNDRLTRPCHLTGPRIVTPVQEVSAFVALQPDGSGGATGNELLVDLTFKNEQNQEEKWVASKTESYEFFTDYLEDIDLCPSIDDGTTK